MVQVARVEAVLFSISLPAYGSIYFKSDLKNGAEAVSIEAGDAKGKDDNRTSGQMCIGPDVAQKWWFEKRSSLNIPRGPCKWREAVIITVESGNADTVNSLTGRTSIYGRRGQGVGMA